MALLLPERIADEVDGLRRAFGVDPTYIPPHVTLVPPINLPEDDLAQALAVLRHAANETGGALQFELGPFDTFLPRNPVLYIAVTGDIAPLQALRDRCLDGPLDRPERRAYVPHVTVTRGLAPEDDAAVRRLLGRYSRHVEVDRLHMLAQVVDSDRGRHWVPSADLTFEPRRLVGSGGVEIELTVTTLADPEARRFLAAHDLAVPTLFEHWRPIVVTGRTDGTVTGVAWGHQAGRGAVLNHVFVAPDARDQGLAGHLVAALEHDVARHGAAVLEARVGEEGPGNRLLVGRGWTERPGPGGPRLWRALGPDDLDPFG